MVQVVRAERQTATQAWAVNRVRGALATGIAALRMKRAGRMPEEVRAQLGPPRVASQMAVEAALPALTAHQETSASTLTANP